MNTRAKKSSVVVVVLVTLMLGGVAVAFWTAGGSGEADATTGDAVPVVVKQTSEVTELRPGGQPQTLSGSFDNTNDGPIYVGRVEAGIARVVKAAGVTGTCDASDYTLTDTRMTVGADVPRGTGVGSWSGAKISFNNKADVNQDACKGATVELAYVAY